MTMPALRRIRALAQRHLAATLLVAIGFGTVACVLVAYRIDLLARAERTTIDTRFAIRGAEAQPDDVLLVMIDEPSLDTYGWPLSWCVHARVLRHIGAGRPSAIAYSVLFVDRPRSLACANRLVDAAASTGGKVALPAVDFGPGGNNAVFGGPDGRRNGRVQVGSSVLGTDSSGVARRLVVEYTGVEAFALKAAEIAVGTEPPRPKGEEGWIDFRGPPGSFEAVSFRDVALGTVAPDRFRGKTIVVGNAATSIESPFATPTGRDMWGVEVVGNEVWTALHGFPLRDAPAPVDWGAIVLLGLAVPISGLLLPLRGTVAVAVAIALLFLVAAQVAFENGRVVSVAHPLGALALATVGALAASYLVAAFDRQRARDAFRRFVPEAVVDQVLSRAGGELRLGGMETHGTVMFTDVRGFTSYSEGRPAAEVIDVLNRYLSEMSDGILAHGGTIVSYKGDGVMAVFGAPIEQADHADRALAAARELLGERLSRFNEWLASQDGGTPFRMGIGLHSGMFASGNVGSERRLEYTAIGDTINTAARLEELTKEIGSGLLLSEETRGALQTRSDDLVYIDELEIRGRRGKIRIWSTALD